MSVVLLNKLALDLVAKDFSDGHAPHSNDGPTKTSRALAIIHLAARDAYANVTNAYKPYLTTLPTYSLADKSDKAGVSAAMGAGICAAAMLYPDFAAFIATQTPAIMIDTEPNAVAYGYTLGVAWVNSRDKDGSEKPQLDGYYNNAAGHHRPDPDQPGQLTLGRNWGQVKPFALTSVTAQASIPPPNAINTKKYADDYDQVYVEGRDNTIHLNPKHVDNAITGIFWGYDGSNKLGTPPRLYNQIVVATSVFVKMNNAGKLNALAAINVAMVDAGIAAWHWKYEYDLWRPVVGIREAAKGTGPTAAGDGNTHRKHPGNPFWLPLGAPKSNFIPPTAPFAGSAEINGTPNFPAYPSGHATFGTACFCVFAALANMDPKDIEVTFASDEFNGITTDNNGITRPKIEMTFDLEKAIHLNNVSRIYLGVHWKQDADRGTELGGKVCTVVTAKFMSLNNPNPKSKK